MLSVLRLCGVCVSVHIAHLIAIGKVIFIELFVGCIIHLNIIALIIWAGSIFFSIHFYYASCIYRIPALNSRMVREKLGERHR